MENKGRNQRQGRLTREQQKRILERKGDIPKAREAEQAVKQPPGVTRVLWKRDARASELPVSRGGMNQESRRHNKPPRTPT
jgi:hypothetical protein